MSRAKIAVEGFEGTHRVTENLGFSHDRNCYAKAVMIDGVERIVVSATRGGPWRINRPLYRAGGASRGVGQ